MWEFFLFAETGQRPDDSHFSLLMRKGGSREPLSGTKMIVYVLSVFCTLRFLICDLEISVLFVK